VEVAAGSKKGASDKEERELNKIFTTMEFTPDGTELLVGQRDGKVQVIDPTSGKYKKLTQPLKVSEEKSPAIKHLVVSEDGSYFAREHIMSMFKTNMPLEYYPFDKLDLRIILEDKDLGSDDVVFVLDDPAVQTSADLSVPGYVIGTPFATVTDWEYPPLGALDSGSSLSSRVTVEIPMQRPWLPSAVKTFVPLLVIVLCAAMVFLIRPEHIDARFGLGISALLTLVALKWITDGEMPLMDYLGFVDSLYLLAFLFIAAGLAETTYTTWQRGQGVGDATLIRHDRRTFAVAATTFIVACTVMVIFYLFV
jgi:hypothetical protein